MYLKQCRDQITGTCHLILVIGFKIRLYFATNKSLYTNGSSSSVCTALISFFLIGAVGIITSVVECLGDVFRCIIDTIYIKECGVVLLSFWFVN